MKTLILLLFCINVNAQIPLTESNSDLQLSSFNIPVALNANNKLRIRLINFFTGSVIYRSGSFIIKKIG